jgi:hypothetical protein
MLCENPMNGGGGYTPEEIGLMTLDQIWFRLCDAEILKRKTGFRVENISASSMKGNIRPNKDGLYKGRDKDGNLIMGRVGGKSLNRQIMERVEREKKEKQKQDRRKKRRDRRERREKNRGK